MMKKHGPDAYARAGVDYSLIDPVKLLSQTAAAKTRGNLSWGKLSVDDQGESAHLIQMPGGGYIALVLEGLGTKSLCAQVMFRKTGDPKYFDYSSRCAFRMIENDLISVGANVLAANMYLAAGNSNWFKNRLRAAAIAQGFRIANDEAGSVWLGGETPALVGIIKRNTYDIAGSAIGIIEKESYRIKGDIEPGDVIIGFRSFGPMANGYTLIRRIAGSLPDGYLTKLPNGQTFGDAIMSPTPSYSCVIKACREMRLKIRYAANITGHGWRKVMRANMAITHRITHVPRIPQVFNFIAKKGALGGIPKKEMFGNYNMGIGFMIWVRVQDVERVLNYPALQHLKPEVLGSTQKSRDGRKRVIIDPHDVVFESEEMVLKAA